MFGRPLGCKVPWRPFDFFFRMGRSYFSRLTRFRMGQKKLPGTNSSNFSGGIANWHGQKKLLDQIGPNFRCLSLYPMDTLSIQISCFVCWMEGLARNGFLESIYQEIMSDPLDQIRKSAYTSQRELYPLTLFYRGRFTPHCGITLPVNQNIDYN